MREGLSFSFGKRVGKLVGIGEGNVFDYIIIYGALDRDMEYY